ncbi:topoisomerase-4 subunit B [Balneicella halophila]|uniref:DNA topoisomerase (ATP-hydrolyzing) n=1 Tax=Balneicella halophila TaxID=1537566 RepID=A0A7L4URL2_BALHA|nr:DNA topoisomerase IV subunit B [Balneicella halophila]PVX50969.1 topoisomerase-4 subunit B [Balneicella halophila]
MAIDYSEDHIKTLEWQEHIRIRPGMYIGKKGDGSSQDDGIYILLKEVIDNSIDEFAMGAGKKIEITIEDGNVSIRDYGRGIPLGKVLDVASKMNTGAKYDSKAFKKSVGLNGVGIKAVNALSEYFSVTSFREGKVKQVVFSKGILTEDTKETETKEPNGVLVQFRPDEETFTNYRYITEYVETMLRNYSYLNSGLSIYFNDHRFYSSNGLLDLLNENLAEGEAIYPIIHLKDEDIEIAITHGKSYGEEYFSFVNGQNTVQGGTHLQAFREGIVKGVRDHYGKNFDTSDIRASIIAAISIKVEEPVFESQTKTKLGSKNMSPDGVSVNKFVVDFVSTGIDNFLHKNLETAEILHKKILQSEKERKAISGIKKLAKERAKQVSLHNKKLRDCRVHYNQNHELSNETSIFITEGDSASGSITKSRDVQTQAVFSLKGKPLNSYGSTKEIVYKNEEFNLLQAALNIENGLDDLRYNNIIIATDADVDGMHIRLLLLTFFLQFFPELVKSGHVYILQTPLFRVRNKKETFYCYTEEERVNAIEKVGKNAEITRFKGLGEISPDEFKHFIDKNMRLEPVRMGKNESISSMLEFFMGKNTSERQDFIIDNLEVELETIE